MESRCCWMMRMQRCVMENPRGLFLGFLGAYLRTLMHSMMETLENKCRIHFSSRGCFGCFTKPTLIIAVDEPTKGLKIQGKTVKNSSITDDFWSTSTCELDNNVVSSQRTLSSISMSNQTHDPHSSAVHASSSSDFVNHGLILWNQTRQQWVGDKNFRSQKQVPDHRLSWNASYQNILGTNRTFSAPAPLSEMVDFLVDIWEQEGLYD